MPKFNRADITEAWLIFAGKYAGIEQGERMIVRLWYLPQRCYRPLHDVSQLTENGKAWLDLMITNKVREETEVDRNPMLRADVGPETIPVPRSNDPFLDEFFS